jgi:UDP-N-acetylmuramate--alanine ligase
LIWSIWIFYSGLDEIRDHFVQFVNKVPFYGAVIICLDDQNVQLIIPQIKRRVITYRHARARGDCGERGRDQAELFRLGVHRQATWRELGRVKLNVPGAHNVCNALAAVAVALDLQLPFEKIAEGLEAFTGAGRRFEIKGQVDAQNILVVDDYGHHPTEIRATLAAAKTCGTRIVTLFQPHSLHCAQAALHEDFRALRFTMPEGRLC